MNITLKKSLLLTGLLAVCALILGGCYRKHIESAPPARKPAVEAAPAPAPKPAVVEEKTEIIEETYVVESPTADEAPEVKVEEADLDAEPTVEAEAIKMEAEKTEIEAVESAEQAPAPMGEMYYVQVGAFSDLANANNVLAKLIAEGYAGSKLISTGTGLYRVQAGAFTDRTSADDALARLLEEYPNGFVLKSVPQE